MTDRVYIVATAGGVLELPADIYERCYRPAASTTTTIATPDVGLVDAQGLALALAVDVSWVLKKARLRQIPFVSVGKYVRFSVAEVVTHLRGSKEK